MTLYMMVPFLQDLCYYKNTTLILKLLKNDFESELIKSDDVNQQV